MSKKAKLYLLIVINLLAWGYVSYRIFAAIQGDDDIEFENVNTVIKKIDVTKKVDTVLLLSNYPDPFLKAVDLSKKNKLPSTNSNVNTVVQKNSHVLKPKIESIAAPIDIKYVGIVKNNDKGTQTAMININGKSYFVKEKDVIEGYTIKAITSESLLILKGKDKIAILK